VTCQGDVLLHQGDVPAYAQRHCAFTVAVTCKLLQPQSHQCAMRREPLTRPSKLSGATTRTFSSCKQAMQQMCHSAGTSCEGVSGHWNMHQS
jgi:hypothetical protein